MSLDPCFWTAFTFVWHTAQQRLKGIHELIQQLRFCYDVCCLFSEASYLDSCQCEVMSIICIPKLMGNSIHTGAVLFGVVCLFVHN